MQISHRITRSCETRTVHDHTQWSRAQLNSASRKDLGIVSRLAEAFLAFILFYLRPQCDVHNVSNEYVSRVCTNKIYILFSCKAQISNMSERCSALRSPTSDVLRLGWIKGNFILFEVKVIPTISKSGQLSLNLRQCSCQASQPVNHSCNLTLRLKSNFGWLVQVQVEYTCPRSLALL